MQWILLINLIKFINLQKFIREYISPLFIKYIAVRTFNANCIKCGQFPLLFAYTIAQLFLPWQRKYATNLEREISEYNQYVRQADSNRRNCDTFANY